MRTGLVLKYIGAVLLLDSAFMLLSAGISWINGMDSGFTPLFLSFLLTAILGMFPTLFVRRREQINAKEGYCIVTGAWLLSCFVGTFPYLLYGGEFNFVNAWFESVSGFTTTGSTILTDVESLPNGLLFWRSATHWIGGIGVVMFALAILPSLGKTKMTLYSVELSTLAKDNYRFQTRKIVYILLFVYVGMTAMVMLRIAGMDWFDAVNHAFSAISTGGFSTKNASIAYFDNLWIELVIVFFTFVSGLHFGLIYSTLTGSRNNLFRSEVTRYYFLCAVTGVFLITLSLWLSGTYGSFATALRDGLFQGVTVLTTTGFATADSAGHDRTLLFHIAVRMCRFNGRRYQMRPYPAFVQGAAQPYPAAATPQRRAAHQAQRRDAGGVHDKFRHAVHCRLLPFHYLRDTDKYRLRSRFHHLADCLCHLYGECRAGIRRGRFDGEFCSNAGSDEVLVYRTHAVRTSGDIRTYSVVHDKVVGITARTLQFGKDLWNGEY